MPEAIRVCIADDHAIVRQGLNAFLSTQPDIVVVASAATGEEILRLAARERPHVALIDLLMPGIGGIETTRRLRLAQPETQVVVLTSSTAQAHVIRALQAGALSYVLKDSTAQQIATAIRLAAQGQPIMATAISATSDRLNKPAHARGPGLPSLTKRELQVLRCIAARLSNAIIAEQLTITEGTVKTHVSNILTKLRVNDRTQAAVLAWRQGVVDPDR